MPTARLQSIRVTNPQRAATRDQSVHARRAVDAIVASVVKEELACARAPTKIGRSFHTSYVTILACIHNTVRTVASSVTKSSSQIIFR